MRDRRSTVWGWGVALWGAFSTAIHVYWGLGGARGLPGGFVMRDHRALFIIDLVAIPLSLVVIALGIAMSTRFGDRFPRRLLTVGIWMLALLCLSHSVPSMVNLVAGWMRDGSGYLAGLKEEDRFSIGVYEPVWFIGGVLALMAGIGWRASAREG